MELKTISAETRSEHGKNPARRARAAGKVPAVLYGGDGQEPVSLMLDAKQFTALVTEAGSHALVQIEVTDDPSLNTPGIVKEVQRHPVRGSVLHADVMRIRLDERIQTLIPVRLTGHTVGVVEGGVLEQLQREIEIECLALEIPECIEVDTTTWEIGHSCHVVDLEAPEGVSILTEGDRTVAAVHTPRVIIEETEAEVEEAVEGEEGEEDGTEEKTEEKTEDK